MMIGYARVSTDDQNMELQVQALERLGCDNIYSDHGISGACSIRPGLEKAMARLKPGDTLAVWRLDRLGRSLSHLVGLLETLGHRRVAFHSITEHINTYSSGGRLVFHMMAALAEFERSLISERTRAGMEAARASGKRFGRQPLLSISQLMDVHRRLSLGQGTIREIAADLHVHPRTIERGLKRITQELTLEEVLPINQPRPPPARVFAELYADVSRDESPPGTGRRAGSRTWIDSNTVFLVARYASTATGILPIRACHSFGPVVWTEVPWASTATVTGMSFTSNS